MAGNNFESIGKSIGVTVAPILFASIVNKPAYRSKMEFSFCLAVAKLQVIFTFPFFQWELWG